MPHSTDFQAAILESMPRAEPLHPELQARLDDCGPFHAVRHPLLYSVPFFPGSEALLNQQFAYKKAALKDALAARDFSKAIWLHERPYRVEAFWNLANQLTDEQYWEQAGRLYVDSENVAETWPLWLLVFGSKRPGREQLMDADEREAMATLPESFTVWCGCTDARQLDGMSWTIERSVAQWFARRYESLRDERGMVVQGTARRDDVLAHFLRRKEAEVLLYPEKVTNRRVVEGRRRK
jgi:hypothetical protein